jgi:hypothetical protein
MKQKVRIVGLSLVSMAGMLLVSGVGWAQAVETPIMVSFFQCETLEEPERNWVDEDGIRHIRNELYRCRRGIDMRGRDIAWANSDRDPTAGYYTEHGYYTFTGRILDGEPTTGVGRYTVEGHKIDGVWNYTSEDVMHVEGGGLSRLSAAWKAGERLIYSGVLLETPGGAKRNGPRSK